MGPFDTTVKIEFAVNRFIEMNEQQIKRLLAEAITRACKMAVMEKFGDVQKLVDETIFSPETRKEIERIISERVREEVNQHIKDMFGNE